VVKQFKLQLVGGIPEAADSALLGEIAHPDSGHPGFHPSRVSGDAGHPPGCRQGNPVRRGGVAVVRSSKKATIFKFRRSAFLWCRSQTGVTSTTPLYAWIQI